MSEDPKVLSESELDEALQQLDGWEVRDGWLRRTFVTPGWPHTMQLVQAIGFVAEAAYHHPDLRVGYAKVTVMLQTHKVGGITGMDIALATKIDEVAFWKPEDSSPLDGFPKNWIR